ncbi:MAG: hypothetical protein IJX46_08490 [Clostridia bacterium]|nr:hypothetical protein [Clostridia bacterium]
MNIKEKLTSRKFWVTLVSILTGVAQLLGADGELAEILGGVALALIPSVIYVITEGKIDAESARGLIKDASAELDELTK